MKSNKYSLLNNQTQRDQIYGGLEDDDKNISHSKCRNEVPYIQLKELPDQSIYESQPNGGLRPQMNSKINQQFLSSGSSINQSNVNMPKMNESNLNPSKSKSIGTSKIPLQSTTGFSNSVQPPFMPITPPLYASRLTGNSAMRVTQSGLLVQPKAPFIPPVPTECPTCFCKQHIPGDTRQYYCCQCKKLNSAQPKFGLFICGICNQYVSYPYNTSNLVQCNICYSINQVPLIPYKEEKKQNVRCQQLNESEIILPEDLKAEIEDYDVATMKSQNLAKDQFREVDKQ